MKVIGVYSGKGGVGKSTVASLLALAMSKKHKTALVDLDINTPSIPVLFAGKKHVTGNSNLKIYSTGFDRKGAIDYSGPMLRKVVRAYLEMASQEEPEIIIVDMPPGLHEVHYEFIKVLTPSFFVLVIQPSKLSEEDAERTSHLFINSQIPIIGVVENMGGGIFGHYKDKSLLGLPRIAAIPLIKDIAFAGSNGKISDIDNPLDDLAIRLFITAGAAQWANVPKALLEGPTFEEIMANPCEFLGVDRHGRAKEKLRFMGLQSWDEVREWLYEHEERITTVSDERLMSCTAAKMRECINNLDGENSGLFMICRPPHTRITLYPGEVGQAHLQLSSNPHINYGLPTLAYQTDDGEVTLFMDEVKPISLKELDWFLEHKELTKAIHSKVARYVPSPEHLEMIGNAFGFTRMSIHENWKEEYQKLGVIGVKV